MTIYTTILAILTIAFLIWAIVKSSDNNLRTGFGIMLFAEMLLIVMLCVTVKGTFGHVLIVYIVFIFAVLQTFASLASLAIYLYNKWFK